MADPRLSSFLRQRGVPEECLTRMQEDRVDATVIHLMDDASLAVYVPAYGDRLAVRRFVWKTKMDQDNCDNDEVKESAGEDQEDDWEHDYSNAETSHEDQKNTSEDADVEDVLSDTSEVIFGPVHFGSSEALQLDDTVVWQPSDHFDDDIIGLHLLALPQQAHLMIQAVLTLFFLFNVKIHRSNLLEEMINQFKDPQILEYPLKFTYINEQGSDAAGISRDVYATFWTELLDHAAEGEELRVPYLRLNGRKRSGNLSPGFW
ncbi:hypothetical protein WMY93_023687 [Mugilogobius chulae]|uniref:Uncharacterized protein n=1 Tax=Mugilogobius chulae TaxID=88201 RepID=A0AAW0NBY0_9GOBI